MPNFVKIGQFSAFVNIFLVGSMMGPQRRKGLTERMLIGNFVPRERLSVKICFRMKE